jgi:hypothetical protein
MTEKEEGERRDVGGDVCVALVLGPCDREKEIEREEAADTVADL